MPPGTQVGSAWWSFGADEKPLDAALQNAQQRIVQTGQASEASFTKPMQTGLSGLISKFNDLAHSGGTFGAVLSGIGLGAGISAFNLLSDAVHKTIAFFGDSVDAAKKLQASNALLDASLKQNIPDWNGNTDAIEKAITAGEKLGFTSLEQRDALRLLVAQTKDENAALEAERVAMDLARLKGIDLGTAAVVVGKAYDGNTTALKKYGIEVDKGTKGVAALAAIEKVAAGQADAFSKTSEGAALRQAAAWEALQEQLGTKLLPAVTAVTNFTTDRLIPALSTVVDVGGKVAGVVGPILTPLFDHFGEVVAILSGYLAARLLVSLAHTAAGFIDFVTAARSGAEAIGAVSEATDANSLATDANTAAIAGNAAAGDVAAASVEAGTTAVEGATAATEANTTATETNTVKTQAATVATKDYVLSLRTIGIAALIAIPILGQLQDALANWTLKAAYAKQFGDDFSKVIDAMGGNQGAAAIAFDGLTKASKEQGQSIDEVTQRFLALVAAGMDTTEALTQVTTGQDLLNRELADADRAMLNVASSTQQTTDKTDDLAVALQGLADGAFPALQKALTDSGANLSQAGTFWAARLKDGETVLAGSADELAAKIPLAVKAASDAAALLAQQTPGKIAAALLQGETDVETAAKTLADAATEKLQLKISTADTRKQISDILGGNAAAIAAAERQFQEAALRLRIAEENEAKKPSLSNQLALQKAQDYYAKQLALLKSSGKALTDQQKLQLQQLEIQLAGYLLEADPKSKEAAELLQKYLKSADPATRLAAQQLLDNAQTALEEHLPAVVAIAQKYGLALPDALAKYKADAAQAAEDQAEAARVRLAGKEKDFEYSGERVGSSFSRGVGSPANRIAAHDAAAALAELVNKGLQVNAYPGGYSIGSGWLGGLTQSIINGVNSTAPGTFGWAVGKVKNLLGGSLPTEGPLQHPDSGGRSIGEEWIDALVAAIARGRDRLPGVMDLGSAALPRINAGAAAAAAAVTPAAQHIENHYHLHVDGTPPVVQTAKQAIAEMQRLTYFNPTRVVTSR